MLARHHHPNVYTEKVSPRGVQHVVSRKPNPERDVSGVPSLVFASHKRIRQSLCGRMKFVGGGLRAAGFR